MAYNTTALLDKITFSNYVDFGPSQDKIERFSWSKNHSNYLDVKLKVFKKDDNKEFQLLQNLTIGQADFNQFTRLRNQLAIAAEVIAKQENLTSVLILTKSKDMEQQFKLAHKLVNVVDRANIKICVTLLRYGVDKAGCSYAQVRFFARKKENEKLQQIVFVTIRLEEFVYLLDIMDSVYDNVFANKLVCNVLKK